MPRDWFDDGVCSSVDPELFFHPDNERGEDRRARDRKARAVCRLCPVVTLCRDYALENHIAYGVWGGLTENDREALLQHA